jgi:hypothetical protein
MNASNDINKMLYIDIQMSEMTESNNFEVEETEQKKPKERKFLKNRWNILMKDEEGKVILNKSYKSHVDMIKCPLNHITSRQLMYYYLRGRDKLKSEEKNKRKSKFNIKITKLSKDYIEPVQEKTDDEDDEGFENEIYMRNEHIKIL